MSSPYQPLQQQPDLEPTAGHPIVGQYAPDLAAALQRANSLGVQLPPKIILGSQAVSRFTRTPITISDKAKSYQDFVQALTPPGSPVRTGGNFDFDRPSTGLTDPSGNQIQVNSYNQAPNYSDVVGTIHHEDIHALLDKAGYTYPGVGTEFKNILNLPLANSLGTISNAFTQAHRAGSEPVELPAYMGAFKPSELPDVTEADRQRYLNALYPTLEPSVAQKLQRIVQSYNASQNPFQQSTSAAAAAPPSRTQLQQQAAQTYSTSVPASRSAEYQRWIQNLNQKRGGDASGDTVDYDLTGAFLGGVQPDARGHLPDTFKKPNHMTFSTDSKYSTPAEPGGMWRDAGNGRWIFYASPTNLKYHSPAELTDYFKKYEPDSLLVLPPQTPVPAGLRQGGQQ